MFDSLNTLKAIDSIILHSGKLVLLCVDETMKLYFLNNTKEYLIKNLAWSAETHRPIKWILLRRLVFSESESYFVNYWKIQKGGDCILLENVSQIFHEILGDATVLKTDQYASLTNVLQETLNQCQVEFLFLQLGWHIRN